MPSSNTEGNRRQRQGPASVACALASALFLIGCDEDQADEPRDAARMTAEPAAKAAAPPLAPARCPAGAANCRAADGRILYVERVDPDGDGDAHFVLLSDESVTGPGVSVIDVRRDLRPVPLPGPGDRLSAAGPVFRGSYGQRQIQADEVNVARG